MGFNKKPTWESWRSSVSQLLGKFEELILSLILFIEIQIVVERHDYITSSAGVSSIPFKAPSNYNLMQNPIQQ